MPSPGARARLSGLARSVRSARRRVQLAPLLAGLLLWVGGALALGAWVGRQIDEAVMERTAAVTGLYVQTLFEPHLQSLSSSLRVDATERSAIEGLITGSQFASDTVALKVWSPDGEIVYSPDARLIGQRFPVAGGLARAVSGSTVLDISDLRDAENVDEHGRWSSLVETYVPVRDRSTGRIIGAAEVYQLPDHLAADSAAAERGAWLGIAASAVLSYLALAVLVARRRQLTAGPGVMTDGTPGGRTHAPRVAADEQAPQREHRLAAMRLVERTDAERREIDAALFVGPAQNLAAALLGVEAVRSGMSPEERHRVESSLLLVDRAISGAIHEIRAIADGLRTPDLAELSIPDVVERALRAHRREAGVSIHVTPGAAIPSLAPATRIALFLAISDAVAYAISEHSMTTISIAAGCDGDWLTLRVSGLPGGSDQEPRADAPAAAAPPGSGASSPVQDRDALPPSLARARDHAVLLGGSFGLRSESGHVVVTARWPLAPGAQPGPP